MQAFRALSALIVLAFALALASTAEARHQNAQGWEFVSPVSTLREGIAWQRAQAWKWQDAAGVRRSRTSYQERRETSIPYLRWSVSLWNARRDRAYRFAKAHPSPRSTVDSCTAAIVDRENPPWDPGRWNAQGSGAFGLPQALPYSKMPRAAWPKSAGGQENPYVQLRWMVGYETGRYGSPCAALAYWNAHGSY